MRRKLIVAFAAAAALMILPGVASAGEPETNFGRHVSQHAQTHGFDGTHNPGMHRGASTGMHQGAPGSMPGVHH